MNPQPAHEEWEKRLSEFLPEEADVLMDAKTRKIFCSRQAIVNFIRQLLAQQAKELLGDADQRDAYMEACIEASIDEWREKLVAAVEKMKWAQPEGGMDMGYNNACDDIISLIKEK